jgi:predicted nucleotidyltransferase
MRRDKAMDCDKLVPRLREILRAEPTVKFAYAFGSVAARSAGPLSDIDVAVYLDAKADAFFSRPVLMERLIRGLGVENVDLVILNNSPATLRYAVISYGKVIKENKPHRVLFETATLSEYLDFSPFRAAQSTSIRRRIQSGDYFG